MSESAPYDLFRSLARDRYEVALRKRRLSFARDAGDPYRAARERGTTAHAVWSLAMLELATTEADQRVEQLVEIMSGLLKERRLNLSADELSLAFDSIAGSVTLGSQPCGQGDPSIFSDICPPVETAARNLGVWPTTKAVQQTMRQLRQREFDALESGRTWSSRDDTVSVSGHGRRIGRLVGPYRSRL